MNTLLATRAVSDFSGVPLGVVWGGSNSPPPEIPKALQNRAKLNPIWKLLKIAVFRTPTPQDVQEKGNKILKLPSVRSCFILAMTNKLVVVINSLKVPKIKKILLYEMKFLIPNYSCLQNPWLWGYRPQISLLSVLNWICWTPSPEQNSWVLHCLSWLHLPITKALNTTTLYKQAVWGSVVRIETALRAGMSRIWNAGGTRDISLLQRFQIGFGAYLRLNGYRGSFHGSNEQGPEFHVVPR